jgi:hypothetical protein
MRDQDVKVTNFADAGVKAQIRSLWISWKQMVRGSK